MVLRIAGAQVWVALRGASRVLVPAAALMAGGWLAWLAAEYTRRYRPEWPARDRVGRLPTGGRRAMVGLSHASLVFEQNSPGWFTSHADSFVN